MSIKELISDLINTPIFPEPGSIPTGVLGVLAIILIVILCLIWRP